MTERHDPPRPSDDRRPPLRMLAAIGVLAALLRLLHNEALLADPLYFAPLGGNLPLLLAAEGIAGGDVLPFDGPISLNSPLYPYILAAVYAVAGVNEFYAVRVIGSVVDAGTCVLVALLAWRHFGRVAAWAAGLALAMYGPMIFFATDLNPVPFTLFLLTAGVVLLDGSDRPRHLLAAGLLLGLAAATRPNLLLAGVLAVAVPWIRDRPGESIPGATRKDVRDEGLRSRLAATLALAGGLALGVAPVTSINLATSGEFVPLTTSAGHNFYIGHNPAAEAHYSLPEALDGDIFENMKRLAEEVEERPMDDTEVSGWYLRRALAHMVREPGRELALLGRRALLLVNRREATTYASYDYQKAFSPLLRFAPDLRWLLLLAAPGALLALRRRHATLWIPLLAGAATVLLFFYIARLRVVVVPTLGVLAGAAVARGVLVARARDAGALGAAALVGLTAFVLASLPLLPSDTSNEWNKAGGVLRVAGRYGAAEEALLRARAENPDNPNTYRNLAVLYREAGRPDAASRAEARDRVLAEEQGVGADAFRAHLERAR